MGETRGYRLAPLCSRQGHGCRRRLSRSRRGFPFGRFLQQAQTVLELGNPQLEVDEIVLRHEPQLPVEGVERCARFLAEPGRIAAPTRRQLLDRGPRLVAASETPLGKLLGDRVRALRCQRYGADGGQGEPLEQLADASVAIALCHAAVLAGAGAVSRASIRLTRPAWREQALVPAPAWPAQECRHLPRPRLRRRGRASRRARALPRPGARRVRFGPC